mgnify:CR=1 FL=1
MFRPGMAKGPSLRRSGPTGGTLTIPTTVPTWTACIEFDYTQFSVTSANTLSNTLFTLLPRQTIEGVVIKTKTAWVGAGITSLTFSVGIGGNLAKFLSPYDGVPAVSGTNFGFADTFGLENFTANTTILISAISVGASLTVLTAGVGCVYIKTAQLLAP